MTRLKTPAERASRLAQIATSYNAILHGPNALFTRPSQPPTPSVSAEDETIADAVLRQLKHEVDQIQGSTRGLKKVFSKPSKLAPTYKDLYAALLRAIEEGGPTGTVVVLLRRFTAIEGDINVAKRASSGIVGIRNCALDSVNPVMIVSVLLKRLWQLINEDTFLFQDQKYTYSLTKYVEKDLFKGPQGQKSELLRLLNIKQAKDRFWATDIDAEQPDDLVNPPADIKEEANRQKQQKRQLAEQHQQARDRLTIKRLTTLQEIEILDMKNKAEIQRRQERARVDSQLLAVHSRNQNALENKNENQRQERLDQRQSREREHIQALQDISISGERQRAQEILTSTESHQRLQLGLIEQRNMKDHEGLRQRLTLEGSFKLEEEKLEKRRSERIASNIQYQKELVDSQDILMSNPNMRRWTGFDPATSTHGLIGPLPMDYSTPGPIHHQNVLTEESVAEILNGLNIKPRKELPPP
ncbi:hypothetical protein HYALB_00006697 [Hymenoscyphus albidus]|uniref:Uncharacterized protein n=1 Tax=Hymenoscyphus albidus TaxID=595503 RepID=A0A9N9Q4Z7_9HELO|nr:hypothetical protein HYALB_00006697 [Hymenoscyphus albidus]